MTKQLLTLGAAILATGWLAAQNVAVTFGVGFPTGAVISPNGVHVAGNFQAAAGFPADWQPNTTAMTDPDGDGIYTVTVNIPVGNYQYKFVNGNAWGNDESVPTSCATGNNRTVSVSVADTFINCFASCATSCNAVVNYPVTFAVGFPASTTVSPNGVHIAGDFQSAAGFGSNWSPASTELTDPDGDGIYTVTVNIPAGTYQYKFVNGNAWGTDEAVPVACATANNRQAVVSAAATFQYCFATCSTSCTVAPPTPVAVTFSVGLPIGTAVSPNGIHVAGSFQDEAGFPADWQPNTTAMTDPDGDGIYSVTVNIPPGTYGYKFINGNAWVDAENVPAACAVSGDRQAVVTVADTFQSCFSSCATTCPAPVAVTFAVGLPFGTAVSPNGVHIAGDFQTAIGLASNFVPDSTEMTDPDGDGIYTFTANLLPGTYQYKFINGNAWADAEIVPAGCGVGVGILNRQAVVTVADTFQNCFASCATTCPVPVAVTFAVSFPSGTAVSPNGVHIAGSFQTAIGLASNFVPDSTEMTDPDGDGIYTFTANLLPGTYQYKFINGNAWTNSEIVPAGCGVGVGILNRQAVVTTAATFQNCFESCTKFCEVPVTFAVGFAPGVAVSPNGVHIAGSFQTAIGLATNWVPDSTEMTDPDGDGIYTVTVSIPTGTYQYKFINGNAWANAEIVPAGCGVGVGILNRQAVVAAPSTFQNCFESCAPSCPMLQYYVNAAATGTNTGKSWADAYTDLQDALATAQAGSTIWVAQGTYKPASVSRDSTFLIPSGVKMYGGFAGTETTLAQRPTPLVQSVLSGDVGATGIGNGFDNSYHVVTFWGADTSTVFDGFRVSYGNASDPNIANFNNRRGGGIRNVAAGAISSPLITNSIISGNTSQEFGGGLFNDAYNGGDASPVLVNTIISGNSSPNGGGVYNNAFLGTASPKFYNCTFAANYGTANGSGMFNFASASLATSKPTIVNSIFWGNYNNTDIFNSNAQPAVSYSIVSSGYNGGTAISSSDPLFNFLPSFNNAPTDSGDFSIDCNSGSPAINSGFATTLPNGITTDINGNPRTVATTDLGAYETATPIAAFVPSGITTFCAGDSVVLMAMSGTSTYQWYKDNNAISGETAASFVAKQSGSYAVTLTSNGCSAMSAATAVKVNALPALALSSNSPVCEGDTLTVSIASPDATTDYAWFAPDSSVAYFPIVQLPNIALTDGGYYVAAALDSNQCFNADSILIMVNPDPIKPVLTGVPSFCASQGTTISVANPDVNSKYLWNTGDTTVSIAVGTAGIVSVAAYNSCGSLSDSVTIIVASLPVTPIIAQPDTSICAGLSLAVNIVGNAQAGALYTWTGGATGTGATLTLTQSDSIRVINSTGCGSDTSAAIFVEVIAQPQVPTVSGAGTICSGQTATLSITNTQAGIAYNWNNGLTTTSITTGIAGNYVVEASNVCDTVSSAAAQIAVVSSPVKPLIATTAQAICVGQSVTLSVSNTATNTNYTWSTAATGSSISEQPTATTQYTVTATNACGNNTSDTISIAVNAIPAAPTTSVVGNTAYCAATPNSVTLSVNQPQTGVTYTWSNATADTSIVVSPAATTVYSVTATNQCGTSAASAADTIEVFAQPAIAPFAKTAFCFGDTLSLTATASNGVAPYSFDWGFATGDTQTFTQAASGISLVATDANGCKDTLTVDVEMGGTQASPNIGVAGSTTLCFGETASLTVQNSNPAYTYMWSNGTQGVTFADTFAVGLQTVSVYSVDALGCSSDSSKWIFEVLSLPVFTAKDSTVCTGTSLGLTVAISGGAAPYSIVWASDAQGQSLFPNPNSVAIAANTPVFVSITDANGCTLEAKTAKFAAAYTVFAAPVPVKPIVLQAADTLISSSAGGNLWYRNDTLLANATGKTLTLTKIGTYKVCVTNAAGCTECSDAVTVTKVSIDGSALNGSVSIYPNPATDVVTVSVAEGTAELTEIAVIDVTGRMVMRTAASAQSATLSLDNLATGVYQLRISTTRGVAIQPLVVQ